MKAQLRTTLTLAALVVTLPAQKHSSEVDGPTAALERAVLIEQQEGDLATAQQAYEALLQDGEAEPVHGDAALRLGSLLWRLGKQDEARPLLARAVQAGGECQRLAEQVLNSNSLEQQGQQERVERARALIARYGELVAQPRMQNGDFSSGTKSKMSNLRTELRMLGKASALAITAHLNRDRTLHTDGARLNAKELPLLRLLVSELWMIGTEPAQQFLIEAAKTGPLPWQRFLSGVPGGASRDLLPALQQFLQTTDPTREVWRNAAVSLRLQSLEWLASCLDSEQPGIQEAGLDALAKLWNRFEDKERWVKNHGETLVAASDSKNLRLRDAAWEVFAEVNKWGGRAASMLLLQQIAKHPTLAPVSKQKLGFEAGDAWLQVAANTASQFPAIESGDIDMPQRTIARLVNGHIPEWTSAALPAATKLLELGYASGRRSDRWCGHLIQTGRPEHRAKLILQSLRMRNPQTHLEAILVRGQSPIYLPAVQQALAQLDQQTQVPWFDRADKSLTFNAPLHYLLQLGAASGHPDSARVLSDFAIDHPGHATTTAYLLCGLSRKQDSEAVRAALRKLLVLDDRYVSKDTRTNIFAELVRAGDRSTIPLMARAYELGMNKRQVQYVAMDPTKPEPRPTGPSYATAGIGFLMESDNPQASAWHGYSDADLAAAWQTLLPSPQTDLVWLDLTNRANNLRVPKAAIAPLIGQLAKRWNQKDARKSQSIRRLLSSTRDLTAQDLGQSKALKDAVRSLIARGDQLGVLVFDYLSDSVAQEFAGTALEQLRESKEEGWIIVLINSQIPLTKEDWLAALNGGNNTRLRALRGVQKGVDPAVVRAIEKHLTDPSNNVREAACSALYRLLGQDCVPLVLPLLQDREESVRKQARLILNQLREVQEQRNFWARNNGVVITTASSAAKLIAQAKPSEASEQRVLAIRSLALLNAPEALPYLIDWSKDADPTVQTAAKQAITQIHARGSANK